jgi:hypothetical protein
MVHWGGTELVCNIPRLHITEYLNLDTSALFLYLPCV